jgi:hypothetical protein
MWSRRDCVDPRSEHKASYRTHVYEAFPLALGFFQVEVRDGHVVNAGISFF